MTLQANTADEFLAQMFEHGSAAARKARRKKLAPGGYLRPLALSILKRRFGAGPDTLDAWLRGDSPA